MVISGGCGAAPDAATRAFTFGYATGDSGRVSTSVSSAAVQLSQ